MHKVGPMPAGRTMTEEWIRKMGKWDRNLNFIYNCSTFSSLRHTFLFAVDMAVRSALCVLITFRRCFGNGRNEVLFDVKVVSSVILKVAASSDWLLVYLAERGLLS